MRSVESQAFAARIAEPWQLAREVFSLSKCSATSLEHCSIMEVSFKILVRFPKCDRIMASYPRVDFHAVMVCHASNIVANYSFSPT
jgi:hypothetical protein